MENSRKCEMKNCQKTAAEYVMDKGAGGWAGYACSVHAQQFPIRETLARKDH